MEGILLLPVFLPIAIGAFLFLGGRRGVVSVIASLLTFILSCVILSLPEISLSLGWLGDIKFELRSSTLRALLLLFSSLFSFLVAVYSVRFVRDGARIGKYYPYLLITLGASNGVFLSDNFALLLLFWGMTDIMLFALVARGRAEPWRAAFKAFFIVGACDLALLLGIVILRNIAGSFTLSEIRVEAKGIFPILSFVLIVIGAFGKAGVMPLHSWIPRVGVSAPAPVLALLPASLCKLMGIYLLLSVLGLFDITRSLSLFLMAMGSVTVFFAAMMALIQRDVRRLLSFHAVGQVGYMVMGIGTGVPAGVIGGLFHTLNSAMCKACLFLGGGSVERRTGRTELEKLGGLAGAMPVSFWTFLIASLSVSGIPPLSGFVSGWMIYQGILGFGGKAMWAFLITAMFGSALTLASFMKLLHSIFLGERPKALEGVRESEGFILFPLAVLSALCVLMGVFAQLPLKYLIAPSLGFEAPPFPQPLVFLGLWNPTLATILILVSLGIGLILFFLGRGTRPSPIFTGGERMDPDVLRVPGVHFFDTIRYMGPLTWAYEVGETGLLDVYNIFRLGGKGWAFLIRGLERGVDRAVRLFLEIPFLLGRGMGRLHTGSLPLYLAWCLIGVGLLIFFIMR